MGPYSLRIVVIPVTVVVAIIAWYVGRHVLIRPNQQSQMPNSTTKDTMPDGLPTLAWVDPIKVGHVREIRLSNGDMRLMRTLSIRPALFEIANFLSPKECEDIIFMAKTQGLEDSRTLVDGVLRVNESSLAEILNDPDKSFEQADFNKDGVLDKSELAIGIMYVGDILLTGNGLDDLIFNLELDKDNDGRLTREEYRSLMVDGKMQQIINYTAAVKNDTPHMRTRLSNTAFLDPLEHVGHRKLFDDMRQRIQDVTGLHKDIIWTSENLQVLRYDKDGHYHCHYDSEDEHRHPDIPCCHYFNHVDDDDCLPCRYVTFFYYLNEPEEGGETAFPIADNDTSAPERMRLEEHYRCDLSKHCHKAKIRYKPKRGTALFWYNHHMDEETGWLGDVDKMSYHGGCDVKRGTKWAANSWINVGKDREQDIESWESYKELVENYDELLKTGENTGAVDNDSENSEASVHNDSVNSEASVDNVSENSEASVDNDPVDPSSSAKDNEATTG